MTLKIEGLAKRSRINGRRTRHTFYLVQPGEIVTFTHRKYFLFKQTVEAKVDKPIHGEILAHLHLPNNQTIDISAYDGVQEVAFNGRRLKVQLINLRAL